MLVGERMTRDPLTILEDTTVDEALKLMRSNKIRRLPVVDKKGKLVGIVAEKDVLNASPSPATSLSIWEIHYLLARLTVKEIMTKQVITVQEDTPLEEAAKVMSDNKIGGLPVVRDGRVVGIITETDMFKIFLELLGARTPGVRLTLMVAEKTGVLAALTCAISNIGGNIISLGTFQGDSPETRLITMKVSGITKEAALAALENTGANLLDVREV